MRHLSVLILLFLSGLLLLTSPSHAQIVDALAICAKDPDPVARAACYSAIGAYQPQAEIIQLLNTIAEEAAEADEAPESTSPNFQEQLDASLGLTISEIDLVRQQIHRCWNLPAGTKDARKMLISIGIVMNPDGMVRTARILDQSRISSDPFYRAMAESALRAVLNPRCQPFKLPPEKYERWKSMKLNFDPREMLGL